MASIVDDEVRFAKVGELFFGWANEHVVLKINILTGILRIDKRRRLTMNKA